MKDVAEAMTGSDLGDGESVDTHDDLFARMQQGMQAKAAAQEAKEAEHNTQAAPRRAARQAPRNCAAKPRRNRPSSPCAKSSASSPAP